MTWLSGVNYRVGDKSLVCPTTTTGLSANLDIVPSDLWKGAPSWAYEGLYLLTVLNPTTFTDFTCIVKNKHSNFGGSTYFSELTRFTVPYTTDKTGCVDKLIQGFMVGDGVRITMQNVSTDAGGTAGTSAVTAYFRVSKP